MSENATAPTNGATVSTNGAAQLSDDEINALADAARDHLPGIRFVGRPLNFSWEGGNWFWKPDREHEEKIGATEIFLVDLRSYSEIWKRWGRMDNGRIGVVTQIGGRRIDGWVNPPRHAMPEYDADLPASDDPWKEGSSLILKRQSDSQLLTWTAVWSSREGMAEFLDIALKQCRDHVGCMPVVLLESASDGKNFKPRLRIVGWEAFDEDASPPADPARGARLREQLEQLRTKYAAPKGDKKPSRHGDLDDELPF
jgi:hypothetical protein